MKFYLEKFIKSLYHNHKWIVEDEHYSYIAFTSDTLGIRFMYYKNIKELHQFNLGGISEEKTLMFEQFIRRYKIEQLCS